MCKIYQVYHETYPVSLSRAVSEILDKTIIERFTFEIFPLKYSNSNFQIFMSDNAQAWL